MDHVAVEVFHGPCSVRTVARLPSLFPASSRDDIIRLAEQSKSAPIFQKAPPGEASCIKEVAASKATPPSAVLNHCSCLPSSSRRRRQHYSSSQQCGTVIMFCIILRTADVLSQCSNTHPASSTNVCNKVKLLDATPHSFISSYPISNPVF